jgi:alpha-maltose-1-phosphate synthase
MNILMLTNEYPPNIYGGAGVHVKHLSAELLQARNGRHRLQVLCFGDQSESLENLQVTGVQGANMQALRQSRILDTLYRNLIMTGTAAKADIIHCHTWYTYLAGCLIKQMLQIPLVVTTHSLEPHRPWKEEQLGNGYHASMWLEQAAFLNADGVIAVSKAMKDDVQALYGVDDDRIRVIYNGIDLKRYQKSEAAETLAKYGIHPDKPMVLFVGRLTRQKGIIHLVNALPYLHEGLQVVLCAGMPDTEEIAREMRTSVAETRQRSPNPIVWVSDMVAEPDLVALYSHASLFVCPSVYEPFGIINLEAMACGTPVIGAAVGGIPDVVRHGETGLLVPFTAVDEHNPEPRDPQRYSRDLADAINQLIAAPEKRKQMGEASRRRVEALFSWTGIARQTLDFYEKLIAGR